MCKVCMDFRWQNPFRLQIVVESIKNRHFCILPRIAQESIRVCGPLDILSSCISVFDLISVLFAYVILGQKNRHN